MLQSPFKGGNVGTYFFNSNNNSYESNNFSYYGEAISFVSGSDNKFDRNIFYLNNNTIQGSANNNFSNNILLDNYYPELFNFNRPSPLIYNVSEELVFSFNGFHYINGSVYEGDLNYSIHFYPDIEYFVNQSLDEINISFTPSYEGVYTLNFSFLNSLDNTRETRKYKFLVGAENSSSIRYYMHADEPSNGQPLALSGTDSGSMFIYPPISEENRSCSVWVQYSIDDLVNFYPIIQNISLSWQYLAGGVVSAGIQNFASYNSDMDSSLPLSSSAEFIFNQTNFTDLNLISDISSYPLYISFKLKGSVPYVKSNSTQQSYADLTYVYTGPKIEQFSEENGSDIRNIEILSSVFNDDTSRSATLEFEGEGNFSIVLNMTDSEYGVYYDGLNCSLNRNCSLNSNEGGIINVTLSLGSYHTLEISNDTAAPTITINSPTAGQTLATSSVNFNITVEDSTAVESCWFSLDNGATNYTMINVSSYYIYTKTSLVDASYNVKFYCNDSFGNRNDTESVTFSISLPSSDANEAASGGSSSEIYYPTEEKLSKGYEIALATNYQTKFNLGGSLYSLRVNNITADTANITISGEPITFILNVGQTQKVDVNSDGSYDLSVFLKSISGGRANFVLTSISEAYGQTKTDTGQVGDNNSLNDLPSKSEDSLQNNHKDNIYFYLMVAVGIIAVLAFVALFIFLRIFKKWQSPQPVTHISAVSRKLLNIGK